MDYTRARYNDDQFFSDISYLRDLINRPNTIKMVDAELAIYNNMTKIEIRRFVDTYHHYKIGYDKGKEQYYSSYPGNWRKRVYAKTEDDLYRRLYDIYATDKTLRTRPYLIGTLFNEAIQWISDTQDKAPKTIKIHVNDFERYFRNTPLAGLDIRDASINDFYTACVDITKDGSMTQKRFSEVCVCFSYLYEYAQIICGLPVTNPLTAPLFKVLKFRPDDGKTDEIKTQALTKEQVHRLWDYCLSHPQKAPRKDRDRLIRYRLIILWNIYHGLRFCELCGLRWQDITQDETGSVSVHVRGTRQYDGSWKPVTKKRTDEGKRAINMIPCAQTLYTRLKDTSTDKTYILPLTGKYEAEYQAYLRECKRAFAYALGLDVKKDRALLHHYTTHTQRTTFASVMFDSGVASDRQIQGLLGHTTIAMSQRYNHDLRGQEALKQAQMTAFAGLASLQTA